MIMRNKIGTLVLLFSFQLLATVSSERDHIYCMLRLSLITLVCVLPVSCVCFQLFHGIMIIPHVSSMSLHYRWPWWMLTSKTIELVCPTLIKNGHNYLIGMTITISLNVPLMASRRLLLSLSLLANACPIDGQLLATPFVVKNKLLLLLLLDVMLS